MAQFLVCDDRHSTPITSLEVLAELADDDYKCPYVVGQCNCGESYVHTARELSRGHGIRYCGKVGKIHSSQVGGTPPDDDDFEADDDDDTPEIEATDDVPDPPPPLADPLPLADLPPLLILDEYREALDHAVSSLEASDTFTASLMLDYEARLNDYKEIALSAVESSLKWLFFAALLLASVITLLAIVAVIVS